MTDLPSLHAAEGGVAPRVLAVVVTYQPRSDFVRNLTALRAQVDALVIVDNGSTNIAQIREAASQARCDLIENGDNLGIAKALNQGAILAVENDYTWLVTFDQDSLVSPGAIPSLLDLWRELVDRDRVGILAMGRRDRGRGDDYYFPRDVIVETAEWRSMRTTITSGAMVRTDLFREIGFFDEKLFIDSVDHEFCLRCRKNGYSIILGKHQSLVHSVGDADSRKFGPLTIWCSNHSPLRRYYMTRNQLEVARQHIATDLSWCVRSIYHLAGGNIVTLVFERDRLRKAQAMIVGVIDFVFRRFGRRRSF